MEADLSAFVKARLKPQLFMTVTLSERWPEFRTIIQSAQNFLNTLSGGAHPEAANPTNFPWEAVEYYYESHLPFASLSAGEFQSVGVWEIEGNGHSL